DDLTVLEMGHEAPLEIEGIRQENVETHRDRGVVIRDAPFLAVRSERGRTRRITQVRCKAVRLQHHPGGHVSPAGVQRNPEEAMGNPVMTQMRRDRESVRACPDNRYLLQCNPKCQMTNWQTACRLTSPGGSKRRVRNPTTWAPVPGLTRRL